MRPEDIEVNFSKLSGEVALRPREMRPLPNGDLADYQGAWNCTDFREKFFGLWWPWPTVWHPLWSYKPFPYQLTVSSKAPAMRMYDLASLAGDDE